MRQEFPIVPAGTGSLWIVGIVALFLVGMMVLFAYFFYSSRHTVFEVSSEGLEVQRSMYGRTIPFEDLDLEQARVLDLRREKPYQLRWRTNGVGLPGYSAGWFKLRNGEKALAFVTSSRVVYVPTRIGYVLMMSPEHSDELLTTLREQAGVG